MPSSSPLPKDYVSLDRAKKLELLWDCITSSAYQGSLPTGLPGKLELLQLLRVDYDRVAIEHDGDELPEGRVKLTHRYGAVSRVRLELTDDHGFTGMFGHGAEAIFRYSEATGGDEPLSSFALKLLVDGHPSVNLLFLPMVAREDDPASDDPNPFARAYCTVTTGATNLQGAAIARAFDATADAVDAPRLRAIRLPLHDVAAIDPTGAVAEHSVVPDRVELHPCPEAISAGHGYATWREVLGRIPAGTPLFELRLAREAGGEALPWARLTAGSGFVFSRYGDERLFFQHHAGPSTASLFTGEPFGPAIERLGPPRLSLPQNDRDAPGRDRTLEAARDEYRYTYAKPNIRGLAMVEELPRSASPRPGWIEQVVEVTLALARNTQKEADEEGSAGLRPSPAAIASTVRKGGMKAVLTEVADILASGTGRGPVSRLDDFARLFQEWRPPAEAFELFLDSSFARARVAGPNPAWIRQVDPSIGLPEDFGVTSEHYRAAVGSGDAFEAARSEGRLFLAEYRPLLELHRGCVPVPKAIELDYAKDPAAWDAAYAEREAAYARGAHPKLLVAPLALFVVPKGGRELVPVAIQLYPNGHRGRTYPVFTPREGMDWLAAKAAVHAADGTVHETVAHLGRTHLVQEAFELAVRNCLSSRHPLHRLLTPHFEGTAFINDLADSNLVSPGSSVDQLLLPTAGGCIQLTGQAVSEFDFNDAMFPRDLELRGVSDRDVLPSYPYRDDGLLVWRAIERWVRGFIEHYYPGDADVVADVELQAFVRQVGQRDARDAAGRTVGGGIKNVGEGGPRVETRDYLVRMVTQIIWNGSAQHAAVNFPQGHGMSYAAHYPLALMGESFGDAPKSEADYLGLLPWHESAQIQVFILKLLSSVYHTRLGHYARSGLPGGWFGSPVVHDLERALRQDLERVEAEIDARNASRPAYRFLRPSEIPQSINI